MPPNSVENIIKVCFFNQHFQTSYVCSVESVDADPLVIQMNKDLINLEDIVRTTLATHKFRQVINKVRTLCVRQCDFVYACGMRCQHFSFASTISHSASSLYYSLLFTSFLLLLMCLSVNCFLQVHV